MDVREQLNRLHVVQTIRCERPYRRSDAQRMSFLQSREPRKVAGRARRASTQVSTALAWRPFRAALAAADPEFHT